jgi:hypothetical protein
MPIDERNPLLGHRRAYVLARAVFSLVLAIGSSGEITTLAPGILSASTRRFFCYFDPGLDGDLTAGPLLPPGNPGTLAAS